jgi:hypothetical protein
MWFAEVCHGGMSAALRENWQAAARLTEMTSGRLQAISFFRSSYLCARLLFRDYRTSLRRILSGLPSSLLVKRSY